MAEGARLESVYTVTPYRGFESLSLRQIQKNRPRGGFFVFAPHASAARRAKAMDGLSKSKHPPFPYLLYSPQFRLS